MLYLLEITHFVTYTSVGKTILKIESSSAILGPDPLPKADETTILFLLTIHMAAILELSAAYFEHYRVDLISKIIIFHIL